MRGLDEGKGGYDDIPKLQVDNEEIMEADEEFEASTRRGSVQDR